MIPCEKCIIFVICKAKVVDIPSMYFNFQLLFHDCCIITDYLKQHHRKSIGRHVGITYLYRYSDIYEDLFKVFVGDSKRIDHLFKTKVRPFSHYNAIIEDVI